MKYDSQYAAYSTVRGTQYGTRHTVRTVHTAVPLLLTWRGRNEAICSAVGVNRGVQQFLRDGVGTSIPQQVVLAIRPDRRRPARPRLYIVAEHLAGEDCEVKLNYRHDAWLKFDFPFGFVARTVSAFAQWWQS